MLFRYRYDTETGLYYLQSRYYNPEWGRFINADAIVGQVGVLLSHNVFAYCMNNPVNMHDKVGFSPAFNSEEQQAQYDDWAWEKQLTQTNSSGRGTNPDIANAVFSAGSNTALSTGEQLTKAAPPIYASVAYSVSRKGARNVISKTAIGLRNVSEFFRVLGVVGTALSLQDDLYGGYTLNSKIGRFVLDAGGLLAITLLTEGMVAIAPIILTTAAISTGVEVTKYLYFNKKNN